MTDTNTYETQPAKEQLASAISTEIMIDLNKVNKWYGDFHVLKDIDLVVHKGERIVVCGPSGSGKSTLIRCINHLEKHQEGSIVVDGMTLDEEGNIYATAGKGERSGIYVFSQEGKHLAFVPTSETPTNCVFGGGSEKSTLYLTAQAPKGADGKTVWGLYRIKLKIKGHHIYE